MLLPGARQTSVATCISSSLRRRRCSLVRALYSSSPSARTRRTCDRTRFWKCIQTAVAATVAMLRASYLRHCNTPVRLGGEKGGMHCCRVACRAESGLGLPLPSVTSLYALSSQLASKQQPRSTASSASRRRRMCRFKSSEARRVALCVASTAARILLRWLGSGTSFSRLQPTVRTPSLTALGGFATSCSEPT